MTDNNSWISDASPDEPVCRVAAHTIDQRLAAVRHYLPLAAERPDEDVEYVHQLRVATRRAVAALDLYRPLLINKSRKALCRELKRIRKAAGVARDLDVLVLRQEGTQAGQHAHHFLQTVCAKRRHAQQPLHTVYARSLENSSLDTHARQLLKHPCRRRRKKMRRPFGGWARKQLRSIVGEFFRAEPQELDDLESLHRFRICTKQLRYAMELLVAAFPPEFRDDLYPMVERLQEKLGDINDHCVGRQRFTTWHTSSDDPHDQKHLQRLVKRERKRLQKSLWQFARWWTPKRSKQFQKRFHKLVDK